MRRWIYLDGPLAAFVLVMIAAAIITSHGTYLFYSYLLPTALAVAATVVLTVGIPLLELAAVLEVRHRWLYIGGIVVLVGLEGLAQYFQAQAGFVARVATQFPDPTGIDVATFARQPWGRALPVLYLALLSIVVVYFGYAASSRIRVLRAQHATQAQRHDSRRALIRRLVHALREARAAFASLRAEIAQLHAALEQARARPASVAPSIPDRASLLAYCRARLADGDTSLAQLAAELDYPESTLRGWLKAVTNGHAPAVF